MNRESNTNFTSSESNKGNCVGNTNCKFNGSANTLNASRNTNCSILGNYNKLILAKCTNAKFSGNENTVKASNETNLNFEGTGNNCTFQSNTNFRFSGSNNVGELKRNTNGQIFGNSNSVEASNNTNLRIDGDFNQVDSVSGTVNHRLKILENSNTRNIITLEPVSAPPAWKKGNTLFGGWLSSFINGHRRVTMNGNRQLFKFNIDYVKQISIREAEYNVGIFQFKMEQNDVGTQVTLDSSKYDQESLRVIPAESPDRISLSGIRNGKSETLEFVAPKITHTTDNGVTRLEISS